VSYRSEEFTINAYLYKPASAAAGERFPGVLWIHGGPTSQFNDVFEPHVQFFVQRGYVVLLPNIRGSSGYGKAFEDANNRCWGHCDLKDVLAGVDYLKKLPYVNPHKMGITGTSYGGIMSMAAAAFAPGVFQAAIPASGYGDWMHFRDEQELRHVKLLEYEFGPFEGNEHVYRKNSSIYSVEQITTPMFLIHGEGYFPRSDASLEFARALEKNYKVFRYKAYPNENYYVRSRANRRQMLSDMLEFFDQFLKDKVRTEEPTPTNGNR
jgi:dipeptidyl aminopeptidase/acylaminoacyl peptidase